MNDTLYGPHWKSAGTCWMCHPCKIKVSYFYSSSLWTAFHKPLSPNTFIVMKLLVLQLDLYYTLLHVAHVLFACKTLITLFTSAALRHIFHIIQPYIPIRCVKWCSYCLSSWENHVFLIRFLHQNQTGSEAMDSGEAGENL